MDAYRIESDGKVIYNIFNLTKGTDGWDPTAMSGIIAELENTGGKQLTDIPVAMKLSVTPKQLEAIGDTVNITTKYLLWGGFESGEPDTVIYVSNNRLPIPQRREIRETSPSGLEGSVTVDIKPNLRKAPSVKKAPKISYDKATGLYRVDYLLSDKGRTRASSCGQDSLKMNPGNLRHLLSKEARAWKAEPTRQKQQIASTA